MHDDIQFEVSEGRRVPLARVVAHPAARTDGRRDGSFPLIALLQLAAFSAALVACVDGRRLLEVVDETGPIAIALWAGGSVVAGFVAVMVGFGRRQRRRTVLAAGAIGALHAPAILAALAAPAPFWRAGPAVAVLLVSTIVLRIRSA